MARGAITARVGKGAERTFAIGDIHGRFDLLTMAIAAIPADGRIICLGDYIDRGPQSRQVVELLMSRPDIICLKGNHEDMLVQAYDDPRQHLHHWEANGGDATMRSYGNVIPGFHIEWMRALPLCHEAAGRIFVHAGLWPGIPLEKQDPEVMMWIRDRFLDVTGGFPAHVVHGHTPRHAGKPDLAEPELLPWRTNLDTGAFHTGVLSVGVFDPQVPGGPVEVLRLSSLQPAEGEG